MWEIRRKNSQPTDRAEGRREQCAVAFVSYLLIGQPISDEILSIGYAALIGVQNQVGRCVAWNQQIPDNFGWYNGWNQAFESGYKQTYLF